jgi:multiple sugar transport system permease protein
MQDLFQRLRGRTQQEKRARIGYVFIAPSLIFVLILFVIPTIYNIYLSFSNWHVVRPTTFAGMQNYQTVLTSRQFWKSLRITLHFTILSVPLTVIFALIVALGFHRIGLKFGSSFIRALYFIPVVASLTAVAYIWVWIFNPAYGLANNLLSMLSLPPLKWLNDTRQVVPSLSLMYVWARLGFNMLILLAGLSAIDRSYYDAAEIDGAGRWQSFLHITLPLLNRQLVLVGIVEVMTALKVFALPFAATGGGPVKASYTLVMHIYESAFQWNRMGESAVASIALFLLILFLTLVQQKLFARRVSY